MFHDGENESIKYLLQMFEVSRLFLTLHWQLLVFYSDVIFAILYHLFSTMHSHQQTLR